jgi:hypothetical protein
MYCNKCGTETRHGYVEALRRLQVCFDSLVAGDYSYPPQYHYDLRLEEEAKVKLIKLCNKIATEYGNCLDVSKE